MTVQYFQYTPSVVVFLAGSVVMLLLMAYAVRQGQAKRFDETLLSFIAIMASASLWSITRAIQLSTPLIDLKLAALAFLYIGYLGSSMSLFAFALSYTGRQHLLTRRNVTFLALVPFVAVLLAATNWYHHLLWTAELTQTNGGLYLERQFQPLFIAIYLFQTVPNLVSLGLLGRMALGSETVYRGQALVVTSGAILVLTAGVIYVLEVNIFFERNVDLIPAAFAAMGLMYSYAVFEFDLLDLVPVARDTVVENMRDGFVVLDTDDRIVDLNPAARTILQEEGVLVGEPVTTAMPRIDALLAKHEHGNQVEDEFDVEIDGQQRFLIVTVTSLYEDGDLIGRLLLFRDITERRSVQKRYQALTENSTDLIFVLDPEGTITYASPSVGNLLSVSPDDIVGEDGFQFVHDEDREEIVGEFERVREDPDAMLRVEYRVADADGEWRYLEGVGRNLLDNQFVQGIVINARDITERKDRERELERTNEQLEQFASVVSHDLRNPINVARGHLDLVRETGSEQSIEEVDVSLDRMETIIEDVLTLARQGQSIGETEIVSVVRIAEDAWSHVDTVEATLEITGDQSIEADPDRLLQLFENLFRNAIEHGRADVTVTVGTSGEGFYVADDGPGIPEDERDEVLDSGYTTAEDGTGFGLAIVSQIAQAHGWSVEVTESADGGAQFDIRGHKETVLSS
jgi:PAS domain S-box-containing protein